MAISTLKNREVYNSTANQTAFPFTVSGVAVPFFALTDIKVFKRETSETADTELTYNASPSSNAQFSVTATNNDTLQGGSITIGGTGYAVNTQITIERVVPFTQEYTLQEGSSIDPTALNTALDRTVAQSQQLDDDRVVTFPASDASSITYNVTESASSRASKILGFDSSGNVNTQTFSSVAGDAVTGGNGIDITASQVSVDVTSDFTFNSGELQLAANSVDTSEIVDSAVTEAKIGNNAVTASKIAGNAVGSAQISDGAVGSSELAGNAVSLATMAQMAQNTVIGRSSSGTGNPEHVSFTLNSSASYFTMNARNSSGSSNPENWRWGNWTSIGSVGTSVGSFGSGNYTNNDGASITLPNSIFTFASTGTYLVEYVAVVFDSDAETDDKFMISITKGDNSSSDTDTNMAGTVWQTATELAHADANIATVRDSQTHNNESNLSTSDVILLTVSDTSTDKLQLACDDISGSDREEWDARGKLTITKIT